jgi:hypothetical protein
MPLTFVDQEVELTVMPTTKLHGSLFIMDGQEMFSVRCGWFWLLYGSYSAPQVCGNGTDHKRISTNMIYCAGKEVHCVAPLLFSTNTRTVLIVLSW